MAYLYYKDVGISGLAAAVPKNVINNYKYTTYFPEEDVKTIVEKTGIKERRFVDDKTCASDLCYAAAEKLFDDMSIDRSEIDLLIFISQTPDYRMPATSIILQDRLRLPKSTIAFDVNMGCSGFIYGMSIAYSMIQQSHFRKVLLLDGETRSKVYSPKDRQVAFLFGDAGVAALIEKDPKYGESHFSLNSDGSRYDLIQIKAGGYRYPSSAETVKEKVVDEYGNIRSEEHGFMNGADVFNFLIREVPRDIKNLLQKTKIDIQTLDYYIFHQANKFMNDYLVKKMKLNPDKVPMSLEKFGNTSSVSIPLTIATQLKGKLNGDKHVMLCGFGVGLSWATALIHLNNCYISNLVEI
ncbi:3-oxoacyl-ACP synthase III family protein [Calditrichota bacterium GD2]